MKPVAKRLPIFVLYCAIPSAAWADNAVVGSGTPGSCTETSFDVALGQVIPGVQGPGGRLTFNCGSAPHTIQFTSMKFLSDFVEIDGGGRIALSGQDATRLFQVALNGPVGETQTDVTLSNIALQSGFAAGGFGGAILQLANTSLTLDRVSITNSRAGLTGGALACEPQTSVTIRNSTFAQNTAQSGGALSCSGNLFVSGSSFVNNDSATATGGDHQGGAIQSWGDALVIHSSYFFGNFSWNGGAIYKRDLGLSIADTTFENNVALDTGGAVISTGTTTLIERSHFKNNRTLPGQSGIGGGALWHNATESCLIADSGFFSNNAPTAAVMRMERGCTLRQVTLVSDEMVSPIVLVLAAAIDLDASTIISSSAPLFAVSNLDLYPVAINDSVVVGDCNARILVTSNGGNVFVGGCDRDVPGDLELATLADLQLDLARDNGGPAPTVLPLAGSPVIDRLSTNCLFTRDSRGASRPADGNADGLAACDSGAVERQPIEVPRLFADGFE